MILSSWPDKPVIWLHAEIKSPPFSDDARREAGFLIRRVQKGLPVTMPDSRPMPGVGPRCHELRIRDSEKGLIWRIIYRIDQNALIIAEVFAKKTQQTPRQMIDTCIRRLRNYDQNKH